MSEYEDARQFLRGNLRTFFTDAAATPYSWFGQRGNIAVSQFVFIGTMIGE